MLNYVVKGKMIGGFALLAYPAEYGNSGVMTFLVNHSGTVYQKDLGDYTRSLAERIDVVRSRSDLEESRCIPSLTHFGRLPATNLRQRRDGGRAQGRCQ